jgi:CRP-like cAMP-binding protein
MTVENERLKLLPHSFRIDADGRRLIEKPTGEIFLIPEKYLHLVDLTEQGVSLAQMARFVKPVGLGVGRFGLIAKYLGFLYDRGLLADRRAIRLAEALKPDYVWRESIAFDELFSFELFRLPAGKPLSIQVRIVVMTALILASVFSVYSFGRGLMAFVGSLRSPGGDSAIDLPQLAPLLVAFLFCFGFSRSLRAVLQAVTIRIFVGAAAPIRFRADCVSISLGTEDLSKFHASQLYLFASCANIALMSLAPFVANFVLPPNVAYFVPAFTMLVLLCDLSPFRRSPVTEWFRALYNFWDRFRPDGQSDSKVEAKVKSLHQAAAFIWGAFFIGFLIGPARVVLSVLRAHLSFGHRSNLVLFLILAIVMLLILVSFLDDITSTWTSQSAQKIRQMWRRKAASQQVDEAILEGHSPSKAHLEKLPVLRQLDREMRDLLISRSRVLHLKEGEAVCRQGESDRSLFIVLSGRLAVARKVANSRRKIVAFLEAGSVFGEVAFFIGQKRSADVVVMEEARVLSIPHDPRMSQTNPSASDELQFRIWFLQSLVSSTTWKELPSEALDALVFAGKRQNFKAGEKVITEGEVADACYFLIQGQATVVQRTKVVNRMKAGDAFGEIALLEPESLRTATVIADSDLLTVRIETERFWHLLGSHLPLGLEVERLAHKRLAKDQIGHSAQPGQAFKTR